MERERVVQLPSYLSSLLINLSTYLPRDLLSMTICALGEEMRGERKENDAYISYPLHVQKALSI